jgi:hypothetical protein
MRESFVALFNNKQLGFPGAAVVGLFAGYLMVADSLLYKIFKGNFVIGPKGFLIMILLASLGTLIFFMAIYTSRSDWLFIPLYGIGISVYTLGARYIKISMKLAPATILEDLKEPIITGFVFGIVLAFTLVILIRLMGVSVWPFVLSFTLAQAVSIVCYVVFFMGIKNYNNEYYGFYIAGIASEILVGIFFYIGYSYHHRQLKRLKKPVEFTV